MRILQLEINNGRAAGSGGAARAARVFDVINVMLVGHVTVPERPAGPGAEFLISTRPPCYKRPVL